MSKAVSDVRVTLRCAVLTVSDTRHPGNDTSGDYLADSLAAAGHACVARAINAGNVYQLRSLVSQWIADDSIQVILVNGGTGYGPGKITAQALTPLLDITYTGFGELFRHLSFQDIGSSSLQSDAFAGSANDTLVFCMPGSTGACRLAWERLIREQLDSTHRPCNFGSHYA